MNNNNLHDQITLKEAQLKAKIARLQAKQRRQKLEKDLCPPVRKSGSGIRFVNAFLIVMAIHVVAIGGFYGISTIRKMHASDKAVLMAKAPVYAGVPETQARPSSSVELSPKASDPAGQQVVKKVALNKRREISKPPMGAPEQSPNKTKEPSPEIRALFARRHGQKQAVAGNECSKSTEPTPQINLQESNRSAEQIHKVTANETLAQIAKNHGIKTAKLRSANGLNDSDDLQVGQKLKIPSPEAHPPLQLAQDTQEEAPSKNEAPEVFTPKLERLAPNGVYTVQRGDNAYMVAHRLGVSFTDLMTANAISNPSDVTIGMKLKVPSNKLASN